MGVELISSLKIAATDDLYKIVSLLNKSLKYDNLMFGLAKDTEDPEMMVFSIYRT